MLQHEDSDEDDFEGYFLQPVNGYNIKDKIILANQELFDSPDITTTTSPTLNRRVKFREILVDYEPEIEYSSYEEDCDDDDDDDDDDEEDLDDENKEVDEEKVDEKNEDIIRNVVDVEEISVDKTVNDNIKIKKISDIIIEEEEEKLQEEEEIIVETNNKITESGYSSSEEIKEQIIEEIITADILPINMSSDTINDDIEEICEEIEDLTIINEKKIRTEDYTLSSTSPSPLITSLANNNNNRESINLSDPYDISTDSKECDSVVEVIMPMSSQTIKVIIDKNLNDNEMTSSIENPKIKPKIQKQKYRVTSFSGGSLSSKDSTSITRTNSLKRPILIKKINSIENKNLKLNLNFRSCCEYKYDDCEVLPKYNGYFSQYGLSKEQLEKRETRIERYRRKELERRIQKNQINLNKSNLNEEEFSKWLYNKMKNPKNHTINMFDYKMKKQKTNKNT